MYFGRVIGSVVATHGIEGLAGNRLLLIERTDELGESLQREEVAVDTVQAGPGDRVVLVSSREAAMAIAAPQVSTQRWSMAARRAAWRLRPRRKCRPA